MSDLWIMWICVAIFAACSIIGGRLREGSLAQGVLLFFAVMAVMLLLCVQWQI